MKCPSDKHRPVLVLCHYFWPEDMATAALVSGVVFELSRRGTALEAIAGQPAYFETRRRLPREMTRDGVRVRRVWSTQWSKSRPLGRVVNTATFALSCFFAVLFGPRPRAIVAVTNPPLLPWVAALAGRLRGVPTILLIHDVYPRIATALGRLRRGGAIERLWRVINRRTYRGAFRVVALGRCMADLLRADMPPAARGSVVVIPNWADGDAIRPAPREGHALLREWGVAADRFVVQYSGNLGLFHDLDTVLEAARRFQTAGDESVHFVFVGEGGQCAAARARCEREGLRNVTFAPFQPTERLPLSLTACDAGLVTLKQEATGCCVPSKLYGILAAGRPALAVMSDQCESARTILRHGCGFVVEPGDAEGLARAIVALRDDAALRARMSAAARAAYEREFTLQAAADAWAPLLDDLPAAK